MNVFGKLFGKDKPSQPSTWVTFDDGDFQMLLNEPARIFWQSPAGIDQLIQYMGPADWDFDLDNMEGARRFYGNQCASYNGVMLCLDKETVGGVELLHGIFKYRAIDNSRAMHFIGIIWIPFENCLWQVNIESIERGFTGMREVIVFTKHPELREVRQVPEEISSKFNGPEDFDAYVKTQPLIILASDDERFDTVVETHPLTLVRGRMRRVLDTMKFAPEVHSLKKFRM